MNEILEKIFAYLPQYFSDCGAIAVGPKSFILRKVEAENFSEAKEYFLFLGLGVAIQALVMSLLPLHADVFKLLTIFFIVTFVGILLFSSAVRAAWWIVGGRAAYEKFFAVYTYLQSPIILFTLVAVLISYGILALFDPASFHALSNAITAQDRGQILLNSNAVWPFFITQGIGFVLSSIWALVGWGAFREINHLSRKRSFVAFLLTGVLSLPAFALLLLVMIALG